MLSFFVYMARHVKNRKKNRSGRAFWDQEYTNAEHLQLSEEAGGDLQKFCRWLIRETKRSVLNPTMSALDLGCGNGRNLVFLAREFGMHGYGCDSSAAAIKEAKRLAEGTNLRFETRSMAGTYPDIKDNSQMLGLDMMSSHFLTAEERVLLRDEMYRMLRPGGYFFMKTFLKDGDLHTERLLSENPGPETGTYIHPVIGVAEYVYGETELIDFLSEKFIVHKSYASHKHMLKGKAWKRRTVSVYAQKDPYA